MTNLELLLIIILWIGYGLLVINKTITNGIPFTEELLATDVGFYVYFVAFLMIAFSPAVLVYRAIYGIFRTYKI